MNRDVWNGLSMVVVCNEMILHLVLTRKVVAPLVPDDSLLCFCLRSLKKYFPFGISAAI